MKKYIYSIVIASSFLLSSCNDDALDKVPQSEISADNIKDIIKNDPSQAASILEGLEAGNQRYLVEYQTTDFAGYSSVKLGTDLMSNDIAQANWHWMGHYYNYLSRGLTSNQTYYIWKFNYKVINNMNFILENFPESYKSDVKLVELRGRVLAMRAAMYFDLIRLYANGNEGIPYYSETIHDTSRVPTATINKHIEDDLLEAYTNLQTYSRASNKKDLINKNVAAGLLARFYLTSGNYQDAIKYAQFAYQGYSPMSQIQLLEGFNDVSNAEWMWGSKIDGTTNAGYSSFFSYMDNTSIGYAGALGAGKTVDKRLYESIPSTDTRKKWFASTTNYSNLPIYSGVKFRSSGDNFLGDLVYMRASEMLLILAEANALAGNTSAAKQALFDLVSKRDASYVLSSNSGQALLNEIRLQKRIELWGEGSAFFDMKRTNTPLERNYTGTNHPTWGQLNYPAGSPKFTFQIPQAELNTNKSITSQNPN